MLELDHKFVDLRMYKNVIYDKLPEEIQPDDSQIRYSRTVQAIINELKETWL